MAASPKAPFPRLPCKYGPETGFYQWKGKRSYMCQFGSSGFWEAGVISPSHQLGAENSAMLGVDEATMWRKLKSVTHHLEESHDWPETPSSDCCMINL